MDWSKFVEKECHACHRKFWVTAGNSTQYCPNCGGLSIVHSSYDMNEGSED